MKKLLALPFFFLAVYGSSANAQTVKPLYAANAKKEARAAEYKYLRTSIAINLALPLADSTEDYWQETFDAMLLLNQRTAFADGRIHTAMDSLQYRSSSFQKAIIRLVYALYPKDFELPVAALAQQTNDLKLFAMCSEYLFMNNKKEKYKAALLKRMDSLRDSTSLKESPFITVIKNKLLLATPARPPLTDLLQANFLPGEMLIYSFQRKNRNYPGLVMVRTPQGAFIEETPGKYFAVPQLARSGTNMPGYITNGNTPQGIFKILGFAVSKLPFIGPTPNIQMALPFEQPGDTSDSITQWLADNYRSILPVSWKNYHPFYEAYYAGMAGRTEIIAHGTTVNPEYYSKQPYYPLTPTEGCLCTKETWSAADGSRLQSDQQKLADAVTKAGGASGYCVVVELDDQAKPVTLKDILPFISK